MVAKPLCPLYKYIIKPLDRAYYPELRSINKINLGINGKLTSSTTTTKNVTYTYKITQSNERIDEFQFNYFDDYPIEYVESGNYVVPIRKGRGVIETSILPISNEFYTQKRF